MDGRAACTSYATPCISYSVPDTASKKIRTVDQQVKSILRTVIERCKKEKSSNCLQVPIEDCYERVSFYTALPKMFVYHVIDDNPYREDVFDDDDHIILMECINIFLASKLSLRIKDLYEKFLKHRKTTNHNAQYTPDLQTFEKKILFNFGYTYKKNLIGPPLILIEDPKLKFDRYNYLYKIKDFREKKLNIYYIDEKYILKLPFKDPVKDQISSHLKCEGLIFFHIISLDGYENGIYVSQEGVENHGEIFKKWMLDIVLYSIKPGSVIVMANNYIHGSLPKNSITRYHSKKCMLQWLRDNDIPCDPNMKKPRIYELIEKCTLNSKDYDIDRVFKCHGHHVLRLPNNFPSLNPTYFLWDYINNLSNFKSLTMEKNVEVLRDTLVKYISNIDKQMWSIFFNSTFKIENQIFEIDLVTEDLLENNCELDEKCFFEASSNFNIKEFLEE
ncbi:uncharacterized protein LOC123869157 [Maniola jurtina]|uniref:uncharacterized protein LOC123869157 n=1 Tax=Maniola jurtina TaxID=191418 RepID=UPI001E68B841|nr:uncharacterized protein LOC123869157 [Maniola jurtina]